jgi:hypothetical protein
MARYKIKDPKTLVYMFLGWLCTNAVVILFTMGGIYFAEEHPKVLNYAKSVCQVDLRSYKTYQCKVRYYQYTCFGPIWLVHFGQNRTINATVEVEKRYDHSSDALKKAYEYQVNNYSERYSPEK